MSLIHSILLHDTVYRSLHLVYQNLGLVSVFLSIILSGLVFGGGVYGWQRLEVGELKEEIAFLKNQASENIVPTGVPTPLLATPTPTLTPTPTPAPLPKGYTSRYFNTKEAFWGFSYPTEMVEVEEDHYSACHLSTEM